MLILSDRIAEFQECVRTAIDYAVVLGVKQVNCLSGIMPEDANSTSLKRTATENLRFAAFEFGAKDIRLLIEPINPFDMPGFYLNTTNQAAEIIEEVGSNNLYIQYDIYHQQRVGGAIIATFLQHQNRIAHVQIADTPGRHEPGTGEINFVNVFEALDNAGYAGWVGCEYRPQTTTLEGLGWMTRYLRASKSGDDV